MRHNIPDTNIMAQCVYLGVIDERVNVENDREQCRLTDNKIGGYPLYSGKCRRFISSKDITCTGCNALATFILQIYCPVDQSPNDRVLYFFACLSVVCGKNECFVYRVINSISKELDPGKNDADDRLFDSSWDDGGGDDGDGNDDDDDDDDDDDLGEVCQSVQQHLSINDADDDGDTSSCQVVQYSMDCAFKPHYIAVFEEPGEVKLTANEVELYGKFSRKEIDDETGLGNGGEEGYEKSGCPSGFRGDTINYKFYKRLQRCPEQLIRYDWCGEPLSPKQSFKCNKPSRCASCSAPRVFELQLMPALINTLNRHKMNPSVKVKLDFESIIIYTCSANCTQPNVNFYREEVILLTEEEVNYKIATSK